MSESTLLDLGVGDVSQEAPLVPKRRKDKKVQTKRKRKAVTASDDGQWIEVGGLVEFSAELSASLGDAKAVWVQIAKVGAFRGHPAGPFELNAKVFNEIVRNFKASDGGRIPIDFEHACEAEASSGSIPVDGAPAQGWILDLDNRGEQGLYALVEWLEPARTYIREGKYKFFSPAIRFNSRDRVTGKPAGARLTSGALTNQPFLSGMMPMAAKDSEGVEEEEEDTDNDAAMAAGEKESTIMADNELTLKLSELTTANADITLQLRDAQGKNATLETELKTLRDEKTLRDAKDLKDEVELAFETYKDSKNLSDADKECMLIVLSANPEKFRASYPQVKPSERHLLRQIVAKREPSVLGEGVGGEEEFVGMDLVSLTARIQKENPRLSLGDAQNLAAKSLGYSPNGRRAG